MTPPVLYFDLGSPYAYLAVERVAGVLGVEPELEPILLGAIFKLRGSGSWAHTPERDERIADIERRAERYGLPPVRWPDRWPPDGLRTMRAATWAKRLGAGPEFARAAFRRSFADGDDLSDPRVLAEVAAAAGLPAGELDDAVADPAVKLELREATDAAWEAGVRGVPTLLVDGSVFYGDDRLEEAAAAVAAAG
jgi:2-hydroxychromene-2-carboxylate isomerase